MPKAARLAQNLGRTNLQENVGNEFSGGTADRTKRCAEVLKDWAGEMPALALVLGSGFQSVADAVDVERVIEYSALPGFPVSMVPGHAGKLLCGSFAGVRLLVCCGRAHYYQGHGMQAVSFAVRALGQAGVKDIVLTNAAGGINRQFRPGDFMLVQDHINFMGENPLRGLPVEEGKCFVDMTDAYSHRLGSLIRKSARAAKIPLNQGVYIAVSGPSYETPAEIRAFRKWGADAVGMSTVPEVLAARYCGMEVTAIACITNLAAGMRKGKLSHDEVLERGGKSGADGIRLLEGFMREYGKKSGRKQAGKI